MIQRLLLSILWLFAVGTAWSVPADSRPFTVTNSDGTVLTIMLCGDEFCHFYATLEGVPVVEEENGDWRLAPELTDSLQQVWSKKSTRLPAGAFFSSIRLLLPMQNTTWTIPPTGFWIPIFLYRAEERRCLAGGIF